MSAHNNSNRNKRNPMVSKKSKAATKKTAPKTPHTRPDGFESLSDDIEGFWDPEQGPIFVKPLFAKLSDSKIDAEKTSTLIFCELSKASPLLDRDKEPIMGSPGDLIGIWAKPGMRAIRNCCGVVTYLALTGEVDTGKINAMKTFEVATKNKEKGTRILIEEDNRRDSTQRSFLEDAPVRRGNASQTAAASASAAQKSDDGLTEPPF